jgi:hypothetical protein
MRRKQQIHIEVQQRTRVRTFFAFRLGTFVLFVAMLIANIIFFAQSVSLSDKLVHLETETRELQRENARLEQTVYTHSSLTNLSELADQLGFTKEAEPVHLDTGTYALVP